LLVVDPQLRISGTAALKHGWFTKFRSCNISAEVDKLDPQILNSLRDYKGVSTLKKAAMNVLVKMLDTKEIKKLRDAFMLLDKDGTGMISFTELKQAIKESKLNIKKKEIGRMIAEIDYAGNKMINYSEFIAATISIKKFLTQEKILAMFK
jgi:calcium-dependent protein kinase